MYHDKLYNLDTKSLYKNYFIHCKIDVYLDCNTVYILKIEGTGLESSIRPNQSSLGEVMYPPASWDLPILSRLPILLSAYAYSYGLSPYPLVLLTQKE